MTGNSVGGKHSFTHSKHALHAHCVQHTHTRCKGALPASFHQGMGTCKGAAIDLHSCGGATGPLVLTVYQASNLESPPGFAHVTMQVANSNQPGCCRQECGQPWQLQATASVRSCLFALALRSVLHEWDQSVASFCKHHCCCA